MVRTWIFQANPKRFRIDAFLGTTPTKCKWLVTEHASKIRVGDTVFVWRAIGGGDRALAGLSAKAIVNEPVEKQEGDTESCRFWVDASEGSKLLDRVEICFLEIHSPVRVKYDKMKNDPNLKDMKIFTFRSGTNFEVSEDEALHLEALWKRAAGA